MVIINSQVQLPCEAGGVPTPSVSWWKDGEKLSRENPNFRFLPNGALRIMRVQTDDKGIYECLATSVAGNDTKLIDVVVQGQ